MQPRRNERQVTPSPGPSRKSKIACPAVNAPDNFGSNKMFRKSLQVVLVTGILCSAIYVTLAEYQSHRAETVAKSLALSERAVETAQSREQMRSETSLFRLSDSLVAEADAAGNWQIESLTGDAKVLLPFRPDEIPDAHPNELGHSPKPNSAGFVGAMECGKCHQEHYQSTLHTAHYQTSASATVATVRGSFDAATSQLSRATEPFRVSVQETETGPIQRLESAQWRLDVPVHIVTGSARSGQTFLFWVNDALFQNYVSYTSPSHEWIPSPGFSESMLDFTRPIRSGCLECHLTYIEAKSNRNHFIPDTAIFGVTCERCHGPGQAHVRYQETHPEDSSKFMLSPSKLSRQQQIDICAQCHSGSFRLRGEPFQFRPGDDIAEHHTSLSSADKVGSIHTSNQQTRLSKSACFQRSEMVCTTCHNPHQNERGATSRFSSRCVQCHTDSHPLVNGTDISGVDKSCVDCHMPTTVDKEMPLKTRRGIEFPSMIDHYIRIVTD